MKKLIDEFKTFIMRGNVMDLAVGVIIGGAFQAIINSLVNDLIMPIISLITGGIDFSNWFIQLGGDQKFSTLAAAQEAGVAVFAYGEGYEPACRSRTSRGESRSSPDHKEMSILSERDRHQRNALPALHLCDRVNRSRVFSLQKPALLFCRTGFFPILNALLLPLRRFPPQTASVPASRA